MLDDSKNIKRDLDLALNLVQILAHKVRTPLSVVTNDLNYLQTIIGAKECDRAIKRCFEISEIFSVIEKLDCSIVAQASFELLPALNFVFDDLKVEIAEEYLISGSCRNFIQAFIWIKKLVNPQLASFYFDGSNPVLSLRFSSLLENFSGKLGFESLLQNSNSDDGLISIFSILVLSTFDIQIQCVTTDEIKFLFVGGRK